MLVVEDGTGTNPDANSYVTREEFVDYWTDRGFDYTVYTTPAIDRSLIQATDYVERNFRANFKGYKLEDDQPLAFPREGIVYECAELPAMPTQLKKATFEYAKRALLSEDEGIQPDPADRDETGNQLKYTFEKIGPIETKIEYLPGSGGQIVQSYPEADLWLTPLIYGGGRNSRTIRG